MQNAILNLMGMNGIQGNAGLSGLTGNTPADGGVSFQEVLKAIGGNASSASGMTQLMQTEGTGQTAVMPELTFDEKLDALLENVEKLSPEVAQAVKLVILEAVNTHDSSNIAQTASLKAILSGLSDAQETEVKAFIEDIFDLVKSGLDSAETDSKDILAALGSLFERLSAVSSEDENEQDEKAVTDSAAEMLAVMVQNYCADNTEVVQAVQDMANGNAGISEIVSYLEKNGVSDDIVKQFSQTADEFVIPKNNGKAPFELLSYKNDSSQQTMAIASVRPVTVSDELKQLLNQNSESEDEKGNLPQYNNADNFAAMLSNNIQHTNNTAAMLQPEENAVPFTQISTQLMENISAKLFEASQKDMTSEMKLLLRPENLGEVAVKLVSENGSVSVMLSAANSQVAKMLSENLPALTAALENQNVAVKDVTVIDPSDAASQMGFAFTSQNSGSERDNSADNHKKVTGVFSLESDKIETDSAALQNNVYENNPKGAKLWATA